MYTLYNKSISINSSINYIVRTDDKCSQIMNQFKDVFSEKLDSYNKRTVSLKLKEGEPLFVKISLRNIKKSKFSKKMFLNDLAAAYSLLIKLGNYLLLCRILAFNP